jgi:hypothetical protein
MATNNTYSAAGQALGFGSSVNSGGLGDQLSQQVGEETEEEKRRRQLGLSVTQSGASPAMTALLGGVLR